MSSTRLVRGADIDAEVKEANLSRLRARATERRLRRLQQEQQALQPSPPQGLEGGVEAAASPSPPRTDGEPDGNRKRARAITGKAEAEPSKKQGKKQKKKQKKQHRKSGEAVAEELPTASTADKGGDLHGVDGAGTANQLPSALVRVMNATPHRSSVVAAAATTGKGGDAATDDSMATLPGWMQRGHVMDMGESSGTEVDSMRGISGHTRAALRSSMGIHSFFAVQSHVIPWLLSSLRAGGGDVVVCAPTGSGKTLAFVVPIVEYMLCRTVRQVDALILLPNRDLAVQVKRVLDQLCAGSHVRSALLGAGVPFEHERQAVMALQDDDNGVSAYAPLVDVIVATPGRLVDHLRHSVGFAALLRQLRFLVLDEADRLTAGPYQDWLHLLLDQARVATLPRVPPASLVTPVNGPRAHPCQKLVFSATISAAPAQLQALRLHQPTYFRASVESRYMFPATLYHAYCVCDATLKPLVLAYWLQFLHTAFAASAGAPAGLTLVFTKSVQAAHRLALLLGEMGVTHVAEYSRDVSPKQRQQLLSRCGSGHVRIVVSTDGLARGMDLPGVTTVISYDVAPRLDTYVHRAGRTARAGKPGLALTLLHRNQVRHWKLMLAQDANPTLYSMRVPKSWLRAQEAAFSHSMTQLRLALAREGSLHVAPVRVPALQASGGDSQPASRGKGASGQVTGRSPVDQVPMEDLVSMLQRQAKQLCGSIAM